MGSLTYKAMQLARAGRLDEAGTTLNQVLSREPAAADALQLLGLVRRLQGDPAAAESLLRRSLEAAPDQPHVLNNLGNVLRDLERLPEAIDCYRSACTLLPDYVESRLNLGIALLAAGDPAAALEALDIVLAARHEPRAWTSRGNALKQLGRYDEAETAYRRAIELQPDHASALHNLGVLCRQRGRATEALDLIESAARLTPHRPEIHYNRGHALLDAGRIDDALNAYGVAVHLRPDYLAAHDSLNKVLWQHGRHRDYLSSYGWAVKRKPDATALRTDWADKLILAGRSEEAVSLLRQSLSEGPDSADIRHRLARALSILGRVDEAEREFRKALEMQPQNPRYLMDLARLQIVQSRYEEALRNVEGALAVSPLDQEAIAYQGACWRLLGDPREAALNDYDNYVRTFRLPPPPGYASIEAFNQDLLRALERLHRTTNAPAEQTLRGGTQTLDDLFAAGVPEVEALRREFEVAVAAYIDGLPEDAHHPLAGRRGDGFRFAGSWSVRLHADGFHVNHVHSQGWISSCYYVSTPACVADERKREGWLRFGESNLHLGQRERTATMIRPESGLLVLFPSYFFHGTEPFRADQHRVTVAFDVVPV